MTRFTDSPYERLMTAHPTPFSESRVLVDLDWVRRWLRYHAALARLESLGADGVLLSTDAEICEWWVERSTGWWRLFWGKLRRVSA